MPFASVRDIRMYYEIRGQGPHLLFIGGTGADLRRRPNVFDFLLHSHFEILAYDQRGQGQTDKPDIPYTMADYAADADGLLEAVGWRSCPVMGVSFGGMVAQEFALRYPDRVERLVLCCTSSGGAGGSSYPLHKLANLPLSERARRFVELSDTRCDDAWQAANREPFQERVDQALAAFTMNSDDPGREIGSRRQLEARRRHDTYDRLPNLRIPVYVCGGHYDGITPAANLRAIKKQIPNAKLELFEGGHQFFLQDPQAFDRIIAFLSRAGDSHAR